MAENDLELGTTDISNIALNDSPSSGFNENTKILPDLCALHKENVIRTINSEDIQRMALLFHQRQQAVKDFNQRLARLCGVQGNGRGLFQLVIPSDKGISGRRALRRAKTLSHSPKEEGLLSKHKEGDILDTTLCKVPIKLDLEIDGYKLRDSFLWSISESITPSSTSFGLSGVSPNEFAQITCEDFELPPNLFAQPISKTITEQLYEYSEFLAMLRMIGDVGVFEGIRGLIRLDITIESLSVVDRFEWDLGERRNDPEQFAQSYARELALPLQFM